MEETKMKNMIVLKNLPSNLIEEAFVIIKSTKKVKKLEKIQKNNEKKLKKDLEKNIKKNINKNQEQDNKYIIKEAEIVISSYIESLEKEETKIKNINKFNKKYKKLKIYSGVTTMILIVQFIITNLV